MWRGEPIHREEYRGWYAYTLRNACMELRVVPEIGGRVIQCKLGEKNFFWVNPTLAGQSPSPSGLASDGGWLNYGGEKLWPAPQGWDNDAQWPGPPDAVLDGQPHRAELLEEDGALQLTSRDDPHSGIRFARIIRMDSAAARVEFEVTMTNVDDKHRRWGIWSVAQMDAGRADGAGPHPNFNVWCPLNPESRHPAGYRVIFGETDHPSYRVDAARGLMNVRYLYRVGKIGMDSHAGWTACVDGESGDVFVQRFQFEPDRAYPDESSVEIWLNGPGVIQAYNQDLVLPDNPARNPYILETELLSPFASLQPGESYTWRYAWQATNIGGNFPVLDCSGAGVVAEPLSVHTDGSNWKVNGRFGVFAPGRLLLRFLDANGNTQGADMLLPEKVSPLKPVQLAGEVEAVPSAASIECWLSDAAGKPLERLDICGDLPGS